MATKSATRSTRTTFTTNATSKDELIHQVATRCNLSLKDTSNAINAFTSTVCQNLAQGKEVRVMGFGTWTANPTSARRIKSIATGQFQTLRPSKRVSFSAGTYLKAAAQGRYTAPRTTTTKKSTNRTSSKNKKTSR